MEITKKDIVSDAWDYKGQPAQRSNTGGWKSAAMILGGEACERLTTLGIGVNLVTYLSGVMHLGNAEAANTVTNFMGTSFMLCLLGGFLADTFLGRYRTIAIFATVQASGVGLLAISTMIQPLQPPPCSANNSSCTPASNTQLGVLYLALYLTALGTGGVKSSVSGFGSDQFDDTDKKERSQMTRFFNWFFFFISLGSLVAVTMLVYIQDNIGRNWGYGICACAILIALMVFLYGTKRYRYKKLVGSPLTQIVAVFVAAWRKRHLELPSNSYLLFNVDDLVDDSVLKSKQKLPHSKHLRFLDKAAIKDQQKQQSQVTNPNKWHIATLTDIEEVKLVIRMLPIWATTIIFWTIYAQMTTFCVAQATTMNRHVSKSSTFEIPAGSLTVFFVGSILLTVPTYDRIVVPIVSKYLHNPSQGLTPLQRIGVGLVLSILSMVSAALIEIKRLNTAKLEGLIGKENSVVSMTVFWLVRQFFLLGAGEAFTYMGQLDFFLRECPKGMKTMSTGLFLTTLSLGFFVSSILVVIVDKITERGNKPWISDNLNNGRLDKFYWLLCGLSVLNLLVYLVFAKRYVYKETWLAQEGYEVEKEDQFCHA